MKRHGGLEISWEGPAKQLLAILQALRDGTGSLGFWQALLPDDPQVAILAGLDRVGIDDGYSKGADALGARSDVQAVTASRLEMAEGDVIFEGSDPLEQKPTPGTLAAQWAEADAPSAVNKLRGPAHWWEGPFDQALRRLRALPDDAGLTAFWDAFPNGSSVSSWEDSHKAELRAWAEQRLPGTAKVENPPEVEVPKLIEFADQQKDLGNPSDARTLYEMAAADATEAWGGGHVFALAARRSVALMHAEEGNVEEACRVIEELVADTERLAADNPKLVATVRNTRTYLYGAAGRHQQARDFAVADEQLATQKFGSDSEEASSARANLAAAEAALKAPPVRDV